MKGVFRTTTFVVQLIIIFSLLCILAGCGGGGSGGGSGGVSNVGDGSVDTNEGYITISNHSSNDIEYCGNITLKGNAFISPDRSGGNYAGTQPDGEDTGVNVTVRNETTGNSASVNQYVSICSEYYGLLGYYYYLCNHTWEASVALEIGDNVISVMATDYNGNTGHDSIIINKPEESYTVSGTVNNLAYSYGLITPESNIWMYLTGGKITQSQQLKTINLGGRVVSGYQFTCVPNGSYTITQISLIDYVFEPENHVINVDYDNVIDVDFITEAYYLSIQFRSNAPNNRLKAIVKILNEYGEIVANSINSVNSFTFSVVKGKTYTINYDPSWGSWDGATIYAPNYTGDLIIDADKNNITVTMPDNEGVGVVIEVPTQ